VRAGDRATAGPASPARPPLRSPSKDPERVGPAGTTAAGRAAIPEQIPPTYTLVPGDHLWKVADATLTFALGHPPGEEQLARYWWRLVQANRAALPDPANPDFVLPGMRVVLPPITP
jgi:hypothetical protein